MPSFPLLPLVPVLVILGGTVLAAGGAEARESLAIEGVAVVDVEGGRATPGRTVVVEGGRIAAVRPAEEPGPAADVVVDGRGMFLLWAPETATLVVERLEDAEWRGNGGEAVRVRRYRNVYETPMGEIDVETWIDPDGVVARAVMEMAMGKLVAERAE